MTLRPVVLLHCEKRLGLLFDVFSVRNNKNFSNNKLDVFQKKKMFILVPFIIYFCDQLCIFRRIFLNSLNCVDYCCCVVCAVWPVHTSVFALPLGQQQNYERPQDHFMIFSGVK